MSICALCGRLATLRQSHYLPAAFFRRMHANGRRPIFVDGRRKMYKTTQVKAKLLCDKCEHRLKVGGEDWATDCTLKSTGSFLLRDLLIRRRPDALIGTPPRANAYWSNRLPELQHTKLLYFAASVLWRGSVLDWSKVDPDTARIKLPNLPNELEPSFRDFLLGACRR